jgi:predicted DNA-binding transcriptional regulator AlpA
MESSKHQLPATGYLRIWHIVGNKRADPPIPAILPMSRSSFLNRVRSGEFPQPIKLGERTTCWRVADIIALVEKFDDSGYEPKSVGEKKAHRRITGNYDG